ncbi:MAG: hypothetical protein ACOYB4_03125 [Methyloceanibacter sp.]
MARAFPLLSLLFVCLFAQPVLALPAPMSEGELLEKSDVVALVRVLSVACTSITKDKDSGEELPGYLANLQILEVKKGDVKPGDEVMVTWRAIPTGIVGPWTVPYYPGEEVWTHLTKRGGGTFASTWWNAKGELVKPAQSTELPTTVGQMLTIVTPPSE